MRRRASFVGGPVLRARMIRGFGRFTIFLFFSMIALGGVAGFLFMRARDLELAGMDGGEIIRKMFPGEAEGLKKLVGEGDAAEKLRKLRESSPLLSGDAEPPGLIIETPGPPVSKNVGNAGEGGARAGTAVVKDPAGPASSSDGKTPGARPSGAPEGRRNPALDEMVLRNGDTLYGRVVTGRIAVRTEHGTVGYSPREMESLAVVYEAVPPYDRITSKKGDRVSGKLEGARISFVTESGDTLEVGFDKLKMVNFAR